MKTTVVYYSYVGSTKIAAEIIAREKNAEIVELKETKKRKIPFFSFVRAGFEAVSHKQSEIQPVSDLGEILYILTPVWGSNPTPAYNAFINQNDLSEKEIYIITVQADKKLAGVDLLHKEMISTLQKLGATVTNAYALTGGSIKKVAAVEFIEEQIKLKLK